MNKEIIVTKPDDCPFRHDYDLEYGEYDCCLPIKSFCNDNINFPPDCPLFENDYIVKRRVNNDNTKKK